MSLAFQKRVAAFAVPVAGQAAAAVVVPAAAPVAPPKEAYCPDSTPDKTSGAYRQTDSKGGWQLARRSSHLGSMEGRAGSADRPMRRTRRSRRGILGVTTQGKR